MDIALGLFKFAILTPFGALAVNASRGLSRSKRSPCQLHLASASTISFRLCDVPSASGMRRSTLLELSGMELHEVAHVRRCFAGELAHGVRYAIVTPLPNLKRFPSDLNRWDSQRLMDERVFVH